MQAYGIHADFFLGQQVFNEIEEALLTDQLEIGILGNGHLLGPVDYLSQQSTPIPSPTTIPSTLLKYRQW